MREHYKKFSKVSNIYLLMMVLFVCVLIMSSLKVRLGEGYTYIIQLVIMLAIPIAMYSMTVSKSVSSTAKDFGLVKTDYRVILVSIVLGCLLYLLNSMVASLSGSIIYFLGYEPLALASVSTGAIYKDIFLIAVLPGICEEVAHRGMLLNCQKGAVGNRKALIISSLCFGLMHLNVQQFFYASILGYFIGLAVVYSRSLFPAIIIHFINNLFSVLAGYLSLGTISVRQSLGSMPEIMTFFILFNIVIVVGVGIWICFRFIKNFTNKQQRHKVAKMLLEQNQYGEILDIESRVNEGVIAEVSLGKMTSYKDMPAVYKLSFRTTIFLGALVTIFTFVWGIM